jgi:PAS domain S-box-containing protein
MTADENVLANSKPYIALARELKFTALPGFARFVRENHLRTYIQEQLNFSREVDLPLLKLFAHFTDEEMIAMSIDAHGSFLDAAADNRLKDRLEHDLNTWMSDELGLLRREDVSAEDITLGTYVRKKALTRFLPLYTTDLHTATTIIHEIDEFSVIADTASTNLYLDMLREKIGGQLKKEREITAELRESKENLVKAQELAAVGQWSWDLESDKIAWSDMLYRIYEKVLGSPLTFEEILSYVEPDNQEKIRDGLRTALKTQQARETYYTIRLGNGKRKILHSKLQVTDKNGRATRIDGTIQDVTERQTLIDKLSESEALHKQAQAMSHLGNWWQNLETGEVWWSDELYHIYGLQPGSKGDGEASRNQIHPDDRLLADQARQRALKEQKPYDIEYRIITPDGKTRILHSIGDVTVVNDKATRIFGTVQDITQQKKAEQRLQEYKDFVEKITNSSPSLIALQNPHTGKFTFLNAAHERLLGHPVHVAAEHGVSALRARVHPDDLEHARERTQALVEAANSLKNHAEEPTTEYKVRIKNAKGEYRWLHSYATIFDRDAKGNVKQLLIISVDITDQENAEQALFSKNIELQRSNQSLEEYAYVASHDLKEPLRKISTFADRILITQKRTLDEDGKMYMGKIMSSARRMQTMVDDLLTVATISGNKKFEESNLSELVAEALQPLEQKIEDKKAVIEVIDLPVVPVVRSQFRQLFQNLVSNSLKFCRIDVQPKIVISARFVNSKNVPELHITKSSVYLQIDVQDNGIGFDQQYAENIFAIFRRLHGKTEYDGTGIGLAICKKIIENHNGIIYAQGSPDEGAKITIVIPTQQQQ